VTSPVAATLATVMVAVAVMLLVAVVVMVVVPVVVLVVAVVVREDRRVSGGGMTNLAKLIVPRTTHRIHVYFAQASHETQGQIYGTFGRMTQSKRRPLKGKYGAFK